MTLRNVFDRVLLPILGFALVIALWEATIQIYQLERIVLPSPSEVAATIWSLLHKTAFWRDVGVSVKEFGIGYFIGALLGILVGVLIGENATARAMLAPVIEALRFIVPFAWIPLTVLWFGASLTGKVVLVAYAVFFIMVVTTARSLTAVDPVFTRVGRTLGMGRMTLALTIRLRAAAPGIASGAKAAAAVGWIAVVAAEYIGASAGLGVMITNASMSLATAEVIAGMMVIGLIGAVVSVVVGLAARFWLNY